jgi:hypothetical protein
VTIVAFASVKGAPGMTTLACLVGATWPEERNVIVVECDRCGGDLAARFRLSSRTGWSSLASAVRRSDGDLDVQQHLQQLPGGLDVLVGTKAVEASESERTLAAFLSGISSTRGGPWDVLVDLGRLSPGDRAWPSWLGHSDAAVIGLLRDAASVMQIGERLATDLAPWKNRLGLAVVGAGSRTTSEIQDFMGVPVLGEIPFDSQAAAVATGEKSGDRRLARSMLAAAARRLAATLAADPFAPGLSPPSSDPPAGEAGIPQAEEESAHRYASQREWIRDLHIPRVRTARTRRHSLHSEEEALS